MLCIFCFYSIPWTSSDASVVFKSLSFYSFHLFALLDDRASLSPRPSYSRTLTAAILPYAVSHLHNDTGELQKMCADAVGYLTSGTYVVSKK